MKIYRITKYNPKNRDKNGVYSKEEWTSISDIGKCFGEYTLTASDYLKVEDQYLKTYEAVLDRFELSRIKLIELEKYYYVVSNNSGIRSLYCDDLEKLFNNLTENYSFAAVNEVITTIKLILREHIWGKLIVQNSSVRIEFGNDFYTYLISDELYVDTIKKINDSGLFIEEI